MAAGPRTTKSSAPSSGKKSQMKKKKKKGSSVKKTHRTAGRKNTASRNRKMPQNQQTFIYILQSTVDEKKSYVGVTNSLPRRLRQHNGELAGGARYTHTKRPWRFFAIFVVANRHDALSIEWKIKHCKRTSDGVGITGKISAACRFGTLVSRFAQISGPLVRPPTNLAT
jgi:predicted GIY-YIG superfamily endonuclease